MSSRSVSVAILVAGFLASFPTIALGEVGDFDFFERKIRPVLVEHCYECHAGEADGIQGGLRLDSRDSIRAGGDSGPAVVAGDVDASLIISAIRYESTEMPPQRKLDDATIADFVAWIEAGAADPRDGDPSSTTDDPTNHRPAIDWDAAAEHWSFIVPQPVESPPLTDHEWSQTKVDTFVLAKLESAGIQPNGRAERRFLLRRLALDLTGIPPTFEEAEAFAADDSPQAYHRAVERLLGSAQHGEHWARLWLDVARYAEDQAHIVGSNKELFYPNAHLYRQWVIDAFNSDMPYDRFCRLQLAADLIEPDNEAAQVALGFIGLGPKYYRRRAPDVMADEWEDRVDTVTRGLMGITVACARCHDHKYDPIPTTDYYALAGVFASTEMFNRPLDEATETKDNGHAKEPEQSLHIVRETAARDLAVMIRGDVNNQGAVVPRGFLSLLGGGQRQSFSDGSGRAELAAAIADVDNPLTARVIVNRVWGQYFGRPLVSTPSNFGMLGTTPTHPELLDDLAARFMANGWSLKWLHREIVMSATYQQSSRIDADKAAIDPANELLWRANRRRLTAEAWRDSLLMAGGGLELSVGGESIRPSDPLQRRRTIYSSISRFQLDPYLALIDFPDPNGHAERRNQTTTPIQKLFTLNSDFIVHQARQLVDRIGHPATDNGDVEQAGTKADSQDVRQRIERAYRLVFARLPDDDELELGLRYLATGDDSPEHWARYAQSLLASNELLIVD